MKTVDFKNFEPIKKETVIELTNEVKETVATGIKTIFSVADLWNIQRRYKTSLYSRC